jgi:hypothetical protein
MTCNLSNDSLHCRAPSPGASLPEALVFLPERVPRPLTLPRQAGLEPKALFLGQGQNALEVAVVAAAAKPAAVGLQPTGLSRGALQAAWKARRGGRASPVLLVALNGSEAALCGPAGEDPPVRFGLSRGQAERLCRAALDQPDRHAALAFLAHALPSLETDVPGLCNEGLFAFHALRVDAQRRPEWHAAAAKARNVAARRERDLLAGLGYRVERLDNLTFLLRGGERRAALAILLDPAEIPEAGTARFNNLSPVSYALWKADAENLPWVVVLHGDRLRLYPTAGVGVGRRGRAETYVEVQTSLLADEHLAYLWLLFSAEALDPKGSVADLLDASARFAGDLAVRLRERIYKEVVPRLAAAVAAARGLTAPTVEELDLTYRTALTVLFRLLFVAYAEDRDLLPYRTNEPYRVRSLKRKAQELAEARRNLVAPPAGDNHWQEVFRLFRAVEIGNTEWGVPAYDGGLFSVVSPAGAALALITLPDAAFEPVLDHLLLIDTPDGPLGPVDFRALGVREFGTIYEGLLESELSVAEVDLALDAKGNYLPRKGHQPVEVAAGAIYLHDRSGARKSSGSYFTKSFAVEHLLDRALEPALDEHLKRLDALDETDAAEALFDFRVADIAMGSGHFLIAAIDRIEKRIADYLSRRPLAGVRAELADLRGAAEKELGADGGQPVIEDSQLLRRLIARRVIYGVDLNRLSVELARLSIWIHTFVPGLPLTVLDHNLVHGNALVGVGTIDQIKRRFEKAATALFPVDADNLLGQAKQPLARLARLADASLKDVAAARDAMEEARIVLGPTRALCDIIAAEPLDPGIAFQPETWERQRQEIQRSPALSKARAALDGLHPLHFPVAFPEVFLRRRAGFDVILGNPPWEKVRTEEHEFWARHFPGLRALRTAERDRRLATLKEQRPDLTARWEAERSETARLRDAVRDLPGMNTGHPDLFRAFAARFIHISASDGGRIGVVLPGDAFKIKGGTTVRQNLVQASCLIEPQFLTNKTQWVFDGVDVRKFICLCSLKNGSEQECEFELVREIHSMDAWISRPLEETAIRPVSWLHRYSDSLIVPTLPTAKSIEIIEQMMRSPRLARHPNLSVRRVYADVETTRDNDLYAVDGDEPSLWPVYGGESFDIWQPDTENYYAQARGDEALGRAQRKRSNSPKNSPYGAMPRRWRDNSRTHPALFPRIAFRDVTNRTNTRTLVCALIPGGRITVQTAPWVLWIDLDHSLREEAFLIGIMSSLIADWWMRRFVEGHVDQEAFDCLRVPAATDFRSGVAGRVVALAGRLAAPDRRFAEWAAAVGVAHGPLPEDEKQDMIAELDALAARLYGLGERQLIHIFETFHEGWDYDTRLRAVLRHFRADGR